MVGFHNDSFKTSQNRLIKGNSFKDLSTIIVTPTRGEISALVVQSWLSLMMPMNQKVSRTFVVGHEVGEAYENAIEGILENEELRSWRYILTLEDDNIPEPNSLLKLYESIDDFDAVGGLYWTKGEEGQPMIYGDPKSSINNMIPQVPKDDLQECNGLGMGFTLFKLDMFKSGKIEKPFFKTENFYEPGKGISAYTQDLYFFEKAKKAGYRFACDTRVRVGHFDKNTGIIW